MFFSCDKETEDMYFISKQSNVKMTRGSNGIEREIHPLIKGHYVDFVNNQHVITITKEEAKAVGIQEDCYDELANAFVEGNRMLKELVDSCLNAGDSVCVESGIYDFEREVNFIDRTKMRREVTAPIVQPSGTISTNGQETGSYGFSKIPWYTTSVVCNCYSRTAFWPTQIVSTNSLGVVRFKLDYGQSVNITVGFAASNTAGSISYKTSDSNGGICAWQGSDQIVSN